VIATRARERRRLGFSSIRDGAADPHVGGAAAVFFVSRDLSIRWRESHSWAIVWPLLVTAGLEGVLGFFQFYTESSHGVATGTYVNRDHYVGLLEMVLPFGAMYPIAVLNREHEGSRRQSPAGPALAAGVILVFATMILTGIVLSLSRMGFIAALVALFVCGAAAVSLSGGLSVSAIRPAWRRSIRLAAVTLSVVLGFLFLPTDALVARFADLANTDDLAADTRVRIWRDAIGLVKAFPLFGCGLGGFESALLRYKTVAPMFTVGYAHNDYLQLLTELGVFGFLAGLVLALRVLLAAVGRAVQTRSVDERFLMIACTGSLTAILLHSFVDFNLYVPANAIVLAWVGGIAITGLREKRRRPDQAPDHK
jgi:O-antigen ligase